MPRDQVRRLATLMISALEGAIMWSRVRRDVRPLDTLVTELSPLLNSHLAEPETDRRPPTSTSATR